MNNDVKVNEREMKMENMEVDLNIIDNDLSPSKISDNQIEEPIFNSHDKVY
ncbi:MULTISPECIES: hypothetical protein [Staphylococcus]|uniref:hypothetical protein n=1 Tax=Staphylococcus TaxID=1279 RepID=UPI0013E92A89|nr:MULTISPECIES: hypothetical protein [Staphylococcus]MBL0378025.1 hypothetical protein [Staphylococcus sp. S75]MBL0384818.1 hypothetical protein [Staphylococcus sp. S59]MBL0402329.1 hypothetical protein [Staphylococcus sp. S36]MDU9372288.1 hypothetical protein [Staphylococcus ureilyticus]